ncbi:YqzL family protein [Paenibacillus yanchengensis]|uniref:YqzL family protein n=1 Tax=Paenibacillus yanchengensis TaxID=2035833 RepID=A0ABW4YK52_9BACL
MRNFSWMYFTMTGDVESFLLYKEIDHNETPVQLQSGTQLEQEMEFFTAHPLM